MYHNYSYNYGSSDMDYQLLVELFSSIMGAVLVIMGLIALVFYILNAVALTSLSKNRGLSSPWIAWIPFAGGYAIGRLSDDINMRRGKTTRQRIILLVTEILMAVSSVLITVFMFRTMFDLLDLVMNEPFDYYSETEALQAMKPFLLFSLFSLPVLAVEIIYMVFQYIALYNIYKSYASSNAIVYLVLTILFAPIATSVFLLMIKNRMPEDTQPPMTGYPPYPGTYNPGYSPYQQYQQYVPNQQQYYAPTGQAHQPAPPQAPEPPSQSDNGETTE